MILWFFILFTVTASVPWCHDPATIPNLSHQWCIKLYWTPATTVEIRSSYHRPPRALQSPSFENANILVSNSEASNVTIRQLIDIKSGQSRVEIREQLLQVQVDSQQSDVNIDPRESHANISVRQPQIFVNASSTTTIQLSTANSEIFVATNRTDPPNAFIDINSPAQTQLQIITGVARINATASERSFARLRTWDYRDPEQITVNSAILPETVDRRGINILGLTLSARIEIELGVAEVHIEFGSILIDISSTTHMITVVSGQFQVQLKTLRSPFSVTVSSNLITLSADNASVLISPTRSNITALTLQALMQIRPADATVSVGGNAFELTKLLLIETRQSSITEIRPQTDQILVESTSSRMLIETQYNQVAVESKLNRVDLQHGNPAVLIETGNTSIEIRKGNGSPGTLPSLPTLQTLPITSFSTLPPSATTTTRAISAATGSTNNTAITATAATGSTTSSANTASAATGSTTANTAITATIATIASNASPGTMTISGSSPTVITATASASNANTQITITAATPATAGTATTKVSATGTITAATPVTAPTAASNLTGSATITAATTLTARTAASNLTGSATITAGTGATAISGTTKLTASTTIGTATAVTAISGTTKLTAASTTIGTATAATAVTAISATTSRTTSTSNNEGDFVTLSSSLSSVVGPPMNMTMTAGQNATSATVTGTTANATIITITGIITATSTTASAASTKSGATAATGPQTASTSVKTTTNLRTTATGITNNQTNQTTERPEITNFRVIQFNVSNPPQLPPENGSSLLNTSNRETLPLQLRQILQILSAQNLTVFTEDTVPPFLVDLFTMLQQNQSSPLFVNGTISDEQLTNVILPFIEQFKFLTFGTAVQNVTGTRPTFSTNSIGSPNETEIAPFLTEFLVPLLQSMETLPSGQNSTSTSKSNRITEEIDETIDEEETPMNNLGASTSSPRPRLANGTVTATSNGRITQSSPSRNGTIVSSNETQADFLEAWPLWNDLIAPIRNISSEKSENENPSEKSSTETPADGLNFLLQLLTPVQNSDLAGRNDTVTLIPELSDDAAAVSRLLKQPQDPAALVIIELLVKPEENTLNPEFVETITEGLKTAYLDGRTKQQGIGRSKRFIVRQVANDTVTVTIEVTTVDRKTENDVDIRFYVVSDGQLMKADKAQEIFNQFDKEQLSTYLGFPVKGPVNAYEAQTEICPVSQAMPIWAVVVLVLLGTLFILMAAVFGYCKCKIRNNRKSQPDNFVIETPVLKDSGRGEGSERHGSRMSTGSQEALVQSASQSESIIRLPFISHKVVPITSSENEWPDCSETARPKLQAWDLDTKAPDFVRQLAETKYRIAKSSASSEVPVYCPEAPTLIERSHIRRVSPTSRKRQIERFIDPAFPLPNADPSYQVMDKYG